VQWPTVLIRLCGCPSGRDVMQNNCRQDAHAYGDGGTRAPIPPSPANCGGLKEKPGANAGLIANIFQAGQSGS